MTKVLAKNYSRYTDVRSHVEFTEVEDRRRGCKVAIGEIPDEHLHFFQDHEGFQILSDAEYAEIMGVKLPDPNAKPPSSPLPDAPPAPGEAAPAIVEGAAAPAPNGKAAKAGAAPVDPLAGAPEPPASA